jgi:hypothetical protein
MSFFDDTSEPTQSAIDMSTHQNVFQKYALMTCEPLYSSWFDVVNFVVDGKVDEAKCNEIASKHGGEFKMAGDTWRAAYATDKESCAKIVKAISGKDNRCNPVLQVTLDEKPFLAANATEFESFPYDLDYTLGNKPFNNMFFYSLVYADYLAQGGKALDEVSYDKLDFIMHDKEALAERLIEYRAMVEVATEQAAGARDIRLGNPLSFTGRVRSIAVNLAMGKVIKMPVKFYAVVNPWNLKKDRNVPVITKTFKSFQDALNDKDGQQAQPLKTMAEIAALIAENLNPALKKKIINDPAGAAKILEISVEELTQAVKANKEWGITL